MAIQLKPYRLKYTEHEIRKMEKTMIETCDVYCWLREHYSKKKLVKHLKIRHANLHALFEKPYIYMTLERLFIIKDLLPEKSFKDILMATAPDYSQKAWYDLEDHEMHILRKKLNA